MRKERSREAGKKQQLMQKNKQIVEHGKCLTTPPNSSFDHNTQKRAITHSLPTSQTFSLLNNFISFLTLHQHYFPDICISPSLSQSTNPHTLRLINFNSRSISNSTFQTVETGPTTRTGYDRSGMTASCVPLRRTWYGFAPPSAEVSQEITSKTVQFRVGGDLNLSTILGPSVPPSRACAPQRQGLTGCDSSGESWRMVLLST